MFSVDYPFAPDARGRDFLNEVALAPADMAKLTPRQCGCAAEAEGVSGDSRRSGVSEILTWAPGTGAPARRALPTPRNKR